MPSSKKYTKLSLGHLCSLAVLFLIAGCETFQEKPDSDTFIFLEPGETLYVRMTIASDLMLEQRFPDIADSTKDRRFRQYLNSMGSLVQLYRLPVNVHLLGEREQPGDGPLLDIFATRWEQDRMGEITAVIRARLERYGEVNTLGSFRSRETPNMMSNYERTEEVFVKTMEDTLSEMMRELNNHFETPAEEAFVEEPLEP
ncbi:hypothetical protein [Pelagicoccus sp. SDUM812002]|uniref:hypothetical protein n=1 Tax=Pelagicoccus sp. SDUM812002 TaxID=3041266 RepID=UPI00280EB21F|nr:hypothetical protein [Pelagicoccus sp. SDUM812002]MDQ8185383.1 hypothetical protein [Pelagicoccus sp. SDUM812002]